MNQTRRRSAGTQLRWGLHPVQVSSWHLLLTMVKQWRICVMFRDRLGRDFGHSCLFDAASCRRICIWRDGQFTTVCFKTPLEFNQPLPFGLLVIGAGCCQPVLVSGIFVLICSAFGCLHHYLRWVMAWPKRLHLALYRAVSLYIPRGGIARSYGTHRTSYGTLTLCHCRGRLSSVGKVFSSRLVCSRHEAHGTSTLGWAGGCRVWESKDNLEPKGWAVELERMGRNPFPCSWSWL